MPKQLNVGGLEIATNEQLRREYEKRFAQSGNTPWTLFYEKLPEYHELKMQQYGKLIASLLAKGPGSVLDIGCGYGALAAYVPAEGYLGVDMVPAFIEAARTKYPHHHFKLATIDEFEGAADIAVLAGVMGALPDNEAVLRAAWAAAGRGLLVDFNDRDRLTSPSGQSNAAGQTYSRTEAKVLLAKAVGNVDNMERFTGPVWDVYWVPKN
jgi:SAM-dependent methyltransferase